MLPPPAPTSAMSIVGIRRSSPAPRISRLPAEIEPPTSYSRPREMEPFSISDALAVVPPMSKAIAFSIPSRLRHAERRDDARRRPRLEREDGTQLRVVGGHHAARRLHDRERCVLQPDPVEAGADAVDVRRHQRTHVGVDHRRRRALVLALLAQDLARERDRRLGKLLGEDLADALLVLGVEVGVEEADRDGVDAELPQAAGEHAHLVVVQRLDDGAVGGHPLGDLEAQPALDERRRLRPEEVVHVRDPQPAQLEDVAEVLGRDERGLGPEALEDGVRGDGRAVHDLARHRSRPSVPASPETASTTARS